MGHKKLQHLALAKKFTACASLLVLQTWIGKQYK